MLDCTDNGNVLTSQSSTLHPAAARMACYDDAAQTFLVRNSWGPTGSGWLLHDAVRIVT
jgi:hypothetical protein